MYRTNPNPETESHPSWVCGLKHWQAIIQGHRVQVTPFVGVWLETYCRTEYRGRWWVTPFVGVWIETLLFTLSLRPSENLDFLLFITVLRAYKAL